jgi:monovalent cation/hydrogen antiporter
VPVALDFVVVALLVVVVANLLADRIRIPAPIILVVAGSIDTFLPGRDVSLRPDVVLYFVVPPLLYAAAVEASLFDIRANLRAVVSLSVLLVVATTFAVGGATALTGAIPFGAAFVLGACVAPPDPVSAMAIARRVGLPRRLTTLIEGEGLLNDAAALTLLEVGIAAVSGHFSIAGASGLFVASVAGGVGIGFAIAVVIDQLRQYFDSPVVQGIVSLVVPYLAFIPAQAAHTSGVLAVVVCGLWLSHRSPVNQSAESRLQIRSLWRIVDFVLQGFVFLLIGQQLPLVFHEVERYSVGTLVAVSLLAVAAVLVVRPLWLVLGARAPGRLVGLSLDGPDGRPLSRREIVVLSWAGTRGVITLAAAFSIPLTVSGHPFPGRPLIIFGAYLVVLVTLLGQGLTFAPLVKRMRLVDTEEDELRAIALTRSAAVSAGLQRLDELIAQEPQAAPVVESLRRAADDQRQRAADRLRSLGETSEDETLTAVRGRLRREMIDAEREEILRWRDAGRLPDRGLRVLQQELDHEEGILPPPSTWSP